MNYRGPTHCRLGYSNIVNLINIVKPNPTAEF